MANSDSTFKITYKEALGEYSVKNTAGTVLDEELCKKYDDNAIAKAKQLKAKHGTEHSDDFYLKIGKSLVLQELIGANTEIYKNRLAGCDIKDMEWAVYSYEEILAMETEGYKIPEEVLQWAHSQQEADVTDYVMVSDATANEDNVTDAMGTSSNELDNLKKKAKQSIAKTDKALEEAAQDIEKYNEIAAKAKKIKEEKEDNYKDTMNKISSKTEEWKQLDEKKKSGKLSRSEERKYKHLSKELNSSNGTIMKEVQLNHAELDSFLETLGDLNVDISDNLTLAQNTIKAGKELGEYEKSYHSAQLPQATSGIIFDGNGKSSDSLYDVKGNEEISEIAIEKGTELNATSNDTLAEITNKENTELSQFANEYTQLATKIENETENAMGEQNNSENKAENEEKKQNKPIDYKVAKNISYQNAILATATTLASTTDLLSRDNGVDKNDKRLQQELKKTQKDSTELTKETTTSETKLEQTQTQENEFLAQLQSIQDSKKDETKPEEKTETTTQQQSLVSQISEKQDESKSLKDLVKNATVKSSASTSKSEKLTKALTERNNNLETRNTNAKKVAEDTQIVGAGTMTKGFADTVIGAGLQSVGSTLMSNPFTFSQGATMFILGTGLIQQGEKELAFGAIAMGTGIAGLTVTKTADNTNKHANETIKEANNTFKANNQKIENAGNIANTESQNPQNGEQNSDTQSNTSTAGTETPQVPTKQPVQTPVAEENKPQEQTSNPEENNTTAPAQANQQQEQKEPEVDMTFGAPNAMAATATTLKATTDMVKDERDMNRLTHIVRGQTKQSEKLIKNIDAETAKAATDHAANIASSEAILNQHTAAQNEIQTAQTQDQVTAAQAKMTTLSTQLDTNATKDEQTTSTADKTVSNSVQQLAVFRKNTTTMNKDLSALDKTMSNQLEASTKTTFVGMGTTAIGIANINTGAGLIISGTALLASPFTASLGTMQIAAGQLLTTKGLAEMTTGTLAAATGTVGTVANAITNAVSKDSDTTLKAANTQNNELEKKARESSKELAEEPATIDETNSDDKTIAQQPEKTDAEQEEENEFLALISQMSASASANINTNESILTDDKADRKLSRFNTESIIESKKKMKKVQAVSASSGGKA